MLVMHSDERTTARVWVQARLLADMNERCTHGDKCVLFVAEDAHYVSRKCSMAGLSRDLLLRGGLLGNPSLMSRLLFPVGSSQAYESTLGRRLGSFGPVSTV